MPCNAIWRMTFPSSSGRIIRVNASIVRPHSRGVYHARVNGYKRRQIYSSPGINQSSCRGTARLFHRKFFDISVGFPRLHKPAIFSRLARLHAANFLYRPAHGRAIPRGSFTTAASNSPVPLLKLCIVFQAPNAHYWMKSRFQLLFLIRNVVAGHVPLSHTDTHMIPRCSRAGECVQYLNQRTGHIHAQVFGVRGRVPLRR